MIRWGAVFTGIAIGAVIAIIRTGGLTSGKGGAQGAVAPTDQMKKAGWST